MKNKVYEVIEQHYRENFDGLVKQCTRRFRNKDDAEEVIQEAYTRACQYWESLEYPDENFNNWFTSILNNCVKDRWGEIVNRGMSVDVKETHSITINPAHFSIELQEVDDKINSKRPNHRKILSLHIWKGLGPKDIDKLVDDKLDAIKMVIKRFKEEIREDLRS